MEDHPSDDIGKLIALKRYESPGEEYFDRFLADFQHRQRGEMLRVSAGQLFLERVEAALEGWQAVRLYAGAATAGMTLVLGLLFWPTPQSDAQLTVAGTVAGSGMVASSAGNSLIREF